MWLFRFPCHRFCVNNLFEPFDLISNKEKRQTILFSATLTPKTDDLAKLSFKKDPLYVGIDDNKEEATVEGLQQVSYLKKIHNKNKHIESR